MQVLFDIFDIFSAGKRTNTTIPAAAYIKVERWRERIAIYSPVRRIRTTGVWTAKYLRSQGDVIMKYFMINARSYTQAEKARLFLARNGIKSTVERTTGRGGCVFSLKIYGDRQEVCPMLARIGLSCDIPR